MGPSPATPRSGRRRHDNDGNLPAGLLLIGEVAILVVPVDDLPEPLVIRIGRTEHPGRALPALAADLDLNVRVRPEVVEPGRMSVGTAVRRDHEVVVAVAGVDESVGSSRARASPDGPEQQGRDADHAMSDASAGSLIELFVQTQELSGEAHASLRFRSWLVQHTAGPAHDSNGRD